MADSLGCIPVFLSKRSHLALLKTTLKTLRKTAPRLEVELVDDGSPAEWAGAELRKLAKRFDCRLILTGENRGFSHAVNHTLRRCLSEGRPAVLINADLELTDPEWLFHLENTPGIDRREASIVGALLTYPNGTIQHGGVHLSNFTRTFMHTAVGGSPDLVELQQLRSTPVTAALMLIRHECLEQVGLLDESIPLGLEDLDLNIRTLLSGRECVFNPSVRATHHESAFRGVATGRAAELQAESARRFAEVWSGETFGWLSA